MASDSSSDGLVLVYMNLYADNCCTFAGTTFLVYEYLITFGREVKFFWRGKWTGASCLFFLNRYLALISYILIMCEFVPMSDKVPVRFWSEERLQSAGSSFSLGPLSAFSALRAFALSGRNILLSVLVFLLGITPLAVNFVQYRFDLDGYNDPTFGCSAGVDLTPSMAKILTIVSRGTLVAADLILILVTWYTLPRRNPMRIGSSRSMLSFSTVLLRDGTIYFVVLLILNVLHLVFTLISVVGVFDPVSFVTEFTEPATAILVSRFLLDLQSANQDALRLDSRDSLNTRSQDCNHTSRTLTFAKIVGSVGLSMDFPESLTGISQTREEDESTAYAPEDIEMRVKDVEPTGDLNVTASELDGELEVVELPVASLSRDGYASQ